MKRIIPVLSIIFLLIMVGVVLAKPINIDGNSASYPPAATVIINPYPAPINATATAQPGPTVEPEPTTKTEKTRVSAPPMATIDMSELSTTQNE